MDRRAVGDLPLRAWERERSSAEEFHEAVYHAFVTQACHPHGKMNLGLGLESLELPSGAL